MRRGAGAWGLVVLAAVSVGIAARAAFLAWSPLPATLDGFRYARLAAHVVDTGALLGAGVQSDELVTTLLLGVAAELAGVPPRYLAQPLVACVGGASVLGAVVLTRGLGRSLDWPARRTRHASVLAALGLAVGGMYLRRSGVPDEEALALLLLPLFALAAHRVLASRRLAWVGVWGLVAVAYPPLHNMSALVAAVTLTALAVLAVARAESRRAVVEPILLAGGFWAYFVGYYTAAERVGLELTYSGLLREYPGAFLAWLIVLAVGVVWLRSTSPRVVRGTVAVGLGVGFLAAAANAVTPVFPGTIRTPPLVLGLVLLYVVPVGLLAWGLPAVVRREGDAPVVVALLVGPVTVGWFTLATALTPEFFGAVQRVQVQAHVAVAVLAAVAAAGLAGRRPALGRAVVAALVLATVLTAPLAFVHLDTATAPRTVHASEFAAVSTAATAGTYASDHRLARVGPLSYGASVAGVIGPTRTWLAGGPPPACPTVAQRSWVDQGAHFFPTEPATLSERRLEKWLAANNLVYGVGGVTETYVVVPADLTGSCTSQPGGRERATVSAAPGSNGAA